MLGFLMWMRPCSPICPIIGLMDMGLNRIIDTSFNEWVNKGLAPPLRMSLRLYKKLKDVGFKIFLLTGRSESQRNITQQNLVKAGYSGWEKLILRGAADEGKKATIYKSEKRGELIRQGYVIQGSSME
ncbi:unnamed protein product [Citrullus colocynthis]|uniref:Acid phosphatase n=1 Tax=Citrullus colocynthis TaxID=252529 RepID=A0ABP0Z1Q0_9ROSI